MAFVSSALPLPFAPMDLTLTVSLDVGPALQPLYGAAVAWLTGRMVRQRIRRALIRVRLVKAVCGVPSYTLTSI
ncbi:hypothetical protein AUC70_03405 [Methyloceanibacter stevinii]|uniref:Uncharacterized protein n=1 Tax=Methyloceanibacter stevinii TaxID=1774970 RepID=A0A1E3VSI5_9HYPH|nr:hypothetical protein AUC70_03405 [Methyloceanibacter stevinii]